MNKLLISILFILPIFCFSNCTAQSTATPSDWNIAPNLNDGWETTNPASVGFVEDSLGALLRLIGNTPPEDFRALVVIKDGKLVVDEYFNSFWYTNIHDIRSAGKSVTSILAGIAMEKGLFKKTDKVSSFFPEYVSNPKSKKAAITVEDLLVMSPGLAADDYVDNSPGREDLMVMAEDYVKFILDLPMDYERGSRYAYSSVTAFLLGAIVEKTSGQTLEDFGRANLFNDLKINGFYWQKSPKGRTTGMGNIYLTARDLAKLGQLMLDKGKWKGKQHLSESFVEASIRKKFDISDSDPRAHGYGYMWYLAKAEIKGKIIDYYFASGNGGNKLFVFPSLDMVVVTLSSAYGQGRGHVRSHLVLEKVLDSIEME